MTLLSFFFFAKSQRPFGPSDLVKNLAGGIPKKPLWEKNFDPSIVYISFLSMILFSVHLET